MHRREFLSVGASLASTLVVTDSSFAASWPNQPIHLVVPYSAGGGVDVTTRLVGKSLGNLLGQPVVVENRPGASTIIASAYVAHSTPNGYTLIMTDSAVAANPTVFPKKLPYDTIKDFESVILLTEAPAILVTRPTLNVSSLNDLVRLIRQEPGKVSCASAGTGTTQQLGSELLKRQVGLDILQIQYQGTSPAMIAVIGGQVDMSFVPLSIAEGYIKTGKLKAIAIASAARIPLMPSLPTFAEAGVPGVIVTAPLGVRAPKGTPKVIIERLNQAFNQVLQEPALRKQCRAWGVNIVGGSSAMFDKYIRQEMNKWRKIFGPTASGRS